jgi:hypothetical protein
LAIEHGVERALEHRRNPPCTAVSQRLVREKTEFGRDRFRRSNRRPRRLRTDAQATLRISILACE